LNQKESNDPGGECVKSAVTGLGQALSKVTTCREGARFVGSRLFLRPLMRLPLDSMAECQLMMRVCVS